LSDEMLKQDWPGAQVVAKPAAADVLLKAVACASTRPYAQRELS
jgi:hypothetical protein